MYGVEIKLRGWDSLSFSRQFVEEFDAHRAFSAAAAVMNDQHRDRPAIIKVELWRWAEPQFGQKKSTLLKSQEVFQPVKEGE